MDGATMDPRTNLFHRRFNYASLIYYSVLTLFATYAFITDQRILLGVIVAPLFFSIVTFGILLFVLSSISFLNGLFRLDFRWVIGSVISLVASFVPGVAAFLVFDVLDPSDQETLISRDTLIFLIIAVVEVVVRTFPFGRQSGGVFQGTGNFGSHGSGRG
jgi:hypothetical protein